MRMGTTISRTAEKGETPRGNTEAMMTEAAESRSTESIGSSMMTGTGKEDAAGSTAIEMGIGTGKETVIGLDIDERTANQPV